MNFFKTFLTTKQLGSTSTINESNADIDTTFLKLEHQANAAFGSENIVDFDCVQLSSHSKQVLTYLKGKLNRALNSLRMYKKGNNEQLN